ncbi:CHAD domain-containing protein [Mucilaginibacter robiniae]|uniref:CHAD domain-containing protein n=1 Tax=Mucilaginibacter robiniae TaxID=2728022 RepID=A0A7L5E3S5_9SPHI|nr:CHAD domain-containing protein [Mucilaginibacter robiniae]QJD96334.1 CHAD domain-containing protein [Mucilaginibacter robiniae]
MKTKEEEKQISKHYQELKAHVKGFLKSAEQEELHQFRVQFKKMRALLTLLQSGDKHPKLLKQVKPIQKMFKKAGVIRGAYVNLQLSHQYGFRKPEFEDKQQQIILSGANRFYCKGPKQLEQLKRTRKKLMNSLHRLPAKTVQNFYQDMLNEAADFLQSPVFDERLHDCRKKIKLLMYNQKVADSALADKLTLNKDYLNQLQDTIGKWHDVVLALELFHTDELKHEPVPRQLKAQKDELQKSIVSLAENFRQKAVLEQASAEKKKPAKNKAVQ